VVIIPDQEEKLIDDIVEKAWQKVMQDYKIPNLEKGEAYTQKKTEFQPYTLSYEFGEGDLLELKATTRRTIIDDGKVTSGGYTWYTGMAAVDDAAGTKSQVPRTLFVKIEAETIEAELTGVPDEFKMYPKTEDGIQRLYAAFSSILNQVGVEKRSG